MNNIPPYAEEQKPRRVRLCTERQTMVVAEIAGVVDCEFGRQIAQPSLFQTESPD